MDFSWIRRPSTIPATSNRRGVRRAGRRRTVRFRAALTRLEDRTLMTTNRWTGTGDWSNVADWSLHHVPTSTENVFISNGSTVTHSTGSDTIKSLLSGSTATVVLSGGTITDPNTFDVPGTFELQGGTLREATVTSDTTIIGSNQSNYVTLNAITLQGILDMRTNSCQAFVSGGLTLSGGKVFLGNVSDIGSQQTYGQLYCTGAAETIDGVSGHPGTITLGLSNSNGLSASGLTGPLTLGANLTINGTAGGINTGTQAFDNKGTITADPTVLGTAAGTITLNGTNWTNDGTIQALQGDSLTLNGTASSSPATHAWTNDASHTVAISGGGTLTLESSNPATTADNTAWLNQGTITSNGSTVDLGGAGWLFHHRGPGHLQPHRRDGQPDRHVEQRRDHAGAEQQDGFLERDGRDGQWRDDQGDGGQRPRGHRRRRQPDRGDAGRQRRQRQPAGHADL
jgi:hypothetical protein